MEHRAAALVRGLALTPHPEGGHFREIFRSPHQVARDGDGERRSAVTAIHFLLAAGEFSRWHRLRADEIWVFLEGAGVRLHLFDGATGELREVRLGAPAEGGAALHAIPAGTWQAAEPAGPFGLVACLVAPGFEFRDESYMADDPGAQRRLRERSPELARLI